MDKYTILIYALILSSNQNVSAFVFLKARSELYAAQQAPAPVVPSAAELALAKENEQLEHENKQLHVLKAASESQHQRDLQQIGVLKAQVDKKDNEIKTQLGKIADQAQAFDAFKLASQKNETALRQEIEKSQKDKADQIGLLNVATEKLKIESAHKQQKADAHIADLNVAITAKSAEVQVQAGLVNELKNAMQKLQLKTDVQESQVEELLFELQKMKEKEQRVVAILALFENSNSHNLVQLIKKELL